MMDGDISVESELGGGSTFTFTARLRRQPVDQERKFVAPNDIYGTWALVVDDCEDNRVIIRKMLESFGLRVETASSGQAALERLGSCKISEKMEKSFKLIMMDWLMPGLDGIETSRIIRYEFHLDIPIIMMTAFGRETERRDAEKVGVNGFLTKPIYQSSLFNAMLDAFGKEALATAERKRQMTTKASIYKQRLKGSHILVAEDNPTNQEIASAILQDAGIEVEIADNGKEALNALWNKTFDAVLMDIQMPEMDGYEATRRIRKDLNMPNLPIIAMTAHAMRGDEEKCLRAGMNGYIPKPINQNVMFHTLWKAIGPSRRKSAAEKPKPAGFQEPETATVETAVLPDRLPGINIEETLANLNIDQTTFKRILQGFYRNNRETIDNMKAALEQENWDELRQIAHSLKGSAANIGAESLQKAAKSLEIAAADETLRPPSPSIMETLESAMNEVLQSLTSLLKSEEKKAEPEDTTVTNPDQALPFIHQLAESLDLSDPESIRQSVESVRPYLCKTVMQKLENNISDYEYDEALAILNELKKQIEKSPNDSEKTQVDSQEQMK
jgi:CheY-like chemotaxis protein